MAPARQSDPSVSEATRGWSTLYFRNPYLLGLTLVVVLTAGVSALLQLPRLEDPRITNRNPLVITAVPGASARRVETLVTEKIEKELQEVAEIKTVESTSRAGVSIVAIELQDSVTESTQPAVMSKIRDKLADAVPELPAEALDPVFDDRRDPAAFTLIVGLTWNLESEPSLGILSRLAEDLADRLRNVPGTELVRLYGEPEEEVTVTADRQELALLGLSPLDLAAALRGADSKVPAGTLRGSRSDLLLEVTGELDSLQRVADVPLRTGSNGTILRIGEVARVSREWRDPSREIGLVDGRRAVFVAARMDTVRRIDRWMAAAQSVVERFRRELGPGVDAEVIFDQSGYTNARLAALGGNLLAGAGVVVLVIFLMMGWRLALIVGLALPLTAAATLFAIQVGGGAIHQMSIFGLIVALGLLIDNAIVVADEVHKRLAQGRSRVRAVAEAVEYLARPLTASTLTTVLAFAPIVLLPGSVGDFVSSIGGSVILALIFSLALALTVVAALTGRFGRPSSQGDLRRWWRDGLHSARLNRTGRRALVRGLRTPVAAVLVALFLPAAGFVVARDMSDQFFPPVDRDTFHLQMWLPTDAPVAYTRDQAEKVEATLRQHPDVEGVDWLIGGSFPSVYYNLVMKRDDSPHYAQAIVQTRSAEATKRAIPVLQEDLDERFPGAQLVLRQFGQGPPIDADLELRLYGPSLDRLQDLGDRIRRVAQAHPDVLHTQVTMPRGEPKLWVDADEDEARLAGLTLAEVAGQLQSGLEGGLGGSLLENLEELPVRIRFDDAVRGDLAAITSGHLVPASAARPLRGGEPEWIPLSAIADVDLRPELGGITRYEGERTNIVRAYTRNGALPLDVHRDLLAELEAGGFELPAGYRLDSGGSVEENGEALRKLMIYAPVLALLAVATLILSFRSLRLALLLGVVAGLSVGLALLSTWTLQLPISFNTILGTFGLLGIAFNDSIVVLAAIRANPAARAGDPEAIADEVLGTSRHVIATTLTTVGGFLPLLLFVGGDFWPSLAIVLAGGVVGAMILALVLVPAVYVLTHPRRAPSPAVPQHAVRWTAVAGGSIPHVLAVGALGLLAVGCTVGPSYTPPQNAAPDSFLATEPQEPEIRPETRPDTQKLGTPPDSAWWAQLDDPLLVRLVERAVEANHDLEIARARVREARASRSVAAGRLLPDVSAAGSAQRSRASEESLGVAQLAEAGLAELENDLFQAGFDVRWELDLFGGHRRGVEAAQARLEATVEARRDTLLTIVAEVAREYVELRGAQRRLDVAKKNIETQANTLRLLDAKRRAGLAPELDVARSRALLETSRASVPPLRARIRASAHRLGVLVGSPPATLVDELLDARTLPTTPGAVPAGLPSELLRRRPDLRRAERQLHAATADIGVATADLFPRFFLTGGAGVESTSGASVLDASSSGFGFLGSLIRWPVFQGGRIRANIRAVEARHEMALARYRQAVLLALEEVESSLVRFEETRRQRAHLAAAVAASARTVELARIRHRTGLTDSLDVLDAERSLLAVEDRLAVTETRVLTDTIALYKALGGGWRDAEGSSRPAGRGLDDQLLKN